MRVLSREGGLNTNRCVGAGWSSLVARRAHNPKVVGSNPAPATNFILVDYCSSPMRARVLP
jgi:hypothetical protein